MKTRIETFQPMKTLLFFLITWTALMFGEIASAGQPNTAENRFPSMQAASPAEMKSETQEPSLQMRRENEKLQAETEKLRAEKNKLEIENRALSVRVRQWSTIAGPLGGIAGALFTLIIGVAGFQLKAAQDARRVQEERLTQDKLTQDKELAREKQTLEIYRDLGHQNPRTQIAAASLLLQRLENYQKKKDTNQKVDDLEKLERPTIIKVLVAVLKEHKHQDRFKGWGQKDHGFEALRKHIADNLVKNIGEPLKNYDWQNANLARVWWEKVDASEADFFQANFQEAGLSEACLKDTVFYEADLTRAVLKGADLAGANFYGATLDEINLKDATYDDKTIWPDGFNPQTFGARRLNKA